MWNDYNKSPRILLAHAKHREIYLYLSWGNEHNWVKLELKKISLILVQRLKGSPKSVGEPKKEMLVKPVQSIKAPLPMLVTPLGKDIEIKPVQPEYLQLVVCQIFLIKTVEK